MWWVILTFCIAVIVILAFLLKRALKLYFEITGVFDELNFFDGGEAPFQKNEVLYHYENVTLLYNIQRGTTEYLTILDTSKYEKNNLIGLTYVVPAADYDKMAKDVEKHIRSKIADKLEDFDKDFLSEHIHETMDGVLIPLCDVYQLKNGRLMWRSKLEG